MKLGLGVMMVAMAPVLVLLHGFTNTGASWKPVVAALGESYRALCPDLRGHGSAADLTPVTLECVLEDIAAAASGEFMLGGYSMGGRIALHFALAFPERVRRLVLLSASPGLADERDRAARRAADERLAEEIERSSIEQFARRWERTPVLGGQSPDVVAAARSDRLRNRPEGLARSLRGLGTGVLPSLWARLAELTMPVSLVVGERDRKFVAIAREMSARIPSASLEIVAGAGHAVHLERPAAVAELIR